MSVVNEISRLESIKGTRPDPGEGWRLLEDEDVTEGDEYLSNITGYWYRTNNNVADDGKQSPELWYRRRVESAPVDPIIIEQRRLWTLAEDLIGKWMRWPLTGRIIGVDCKPPRKREGVWLVVNQTSGFVDYVEFDETGKSYDTYGE